eukprot:m.368314 g.368314  ORF g.368314 m.368314 type:complete len:176 (-) comp20842_c1_seq28:558-1085(-)
MRVHTLYPTCASMPQCHRSHSKPRPVTRPTVLHRRPNMRIRVVPVLGTQPAMFGQAAAAHVLTTLGRKPFRPHTVEPVSRSFSAKQCDRLKTREKRIFHNAPAPTTPGSSDAAPYTPVADCNEAAYVIVSMCDTTVDCLSAIERAFRSARVAVTGIAVEQQKCVQRHPHRQSQGI